MKFFSLSIFALRNATTVVAVDEQIISGDAP